MMLNFHLERFSRLSSERPVLYIVEDVHWTDPTSLELLDLQIERVADISTLMLITYRPEFNAPWVGRPHVTSMTLNRLNRRNAAVMADTVSSGKVLPDEVREQIVEKTDGVPMFIEEMTKSLFESGTLKDEGGRLTLQAPIDDRTVPSTLRDLLEARLDRLGPAKEIAQIGAAIGREFPHRLVAKVLGTDASTLETLVEPLIRSELFSRRGSGPDTTYIFKHGLVQDAAYGSLLRRAKQNIHRDIAVALEKYAPETVETEPEILAFHYTEAGLFEAAIANWQHAGSRFVARSAHEEAIAHYQNALNLIEKLSESPERDAKELDLLINQFNPIMASKGYGAPELDLAQVRALELCERLDDTQRMLPILHGRYTYNQGVGRPAVALEFAQEYLRRAESLDDDTALMIGHRAVGAALWHVGRLVPALKHVEQALELYQPDLHRALVTQYGYDIKTTALMNQIVLLGSLGYPERAAAILREALEYSRALDHPESLAFLLGHVGLTQHFIARDPAGARRCAEQLQAFAEKFQIPTWLPMNLVQLGRALFDDGNHQKGIEMMQESLGGPDEKRVGVGGPAHQVLLADALARTNEFEQALSYLDSAQEITDAGEDRWSESEIWRVRGDVLLKSAGANDAETSYRRAIKIASGQEAKTFELRAATSLSRMLIGQDRGDEARELLSPIFDWFTEGFETQDLQEAKTLLEEL
jgi:tetratricopeptide (TPR) repeat protein